MQVALVAAPYDTRSYKVGENLGLKYLAASLKSFGHEVDLYEMGLSGMSSDGLCAHLAEKNYPLVGFSVLFTSNLARTITVAEAARKVCPLSHFSIGGQGTSFVWKNILDESRAFDSAVCFEGEQTIVEIVNALESNSKSLQDVRGLFFQSPQGPVFTGYREPLVNLDSLPFPVRNEYSYVNKRPVFTMLTSRGCSAHCTFCCSGSFGNKYHKQPRWRARSPTNIITEIDHLVNCYGVRHVTFVDDDFLGACEEGPPRAAEFLDLLGSRPYEISWGIECRVDEVEINLFREMRQAGLVYVLCGVDTGNPHDLKLFGKGATLAQAAEAIATLRLLGMSVKMGFIMFHPLTDLNEIRENLSFLSHIGMAGYGVLTNKLELFNGSPLLTYFSRYCKIDQSDFTYRYQFQDPRVELYQSVLAESLDPFRGIERKIANLRIRLLTRIDVDNTIQVQNSRRLSELATLEEAVNRFELEFAKKLLVEFQALSINCNVDEIRQHLLEDFATESLEKCFQLSDQYRRMCF